MGNDFPNGDNMGDDYHEEDDNKEEDFLIVDMNNFWEELTSLWCRHIL